LPQKISGKVPRQSCWKWPEKRLDPAVKSQKKKKWISDDTYAVIREKREAKGKDKNRYQELKADYRKSSEWINSSSWKACVRNYKQQTQKEIPDRSFR